MKYPRSNFAYQPKMIIWALICTIEYIKNKQMKRTILIIILFLTISNARSQAFSLDTTFNVDFNFYPFAGSFTLVRNALFEPDGKIMVYGDFSDLSTGGDIIRIYNNGNRDNTWTHYPNLGCTYIKKVNNDYLIFSQYNSESKLNYYGQGIDTAWSNNLRKNDWCKILSYPYVWDNGSMMVGSHATCNNPGLYSRWLKKYFADGNMDTNFMHYPNGMVGGVFKYSSDKFLLWAEGPPGNGFTTYDNQAAVRFCRIDTAGNLDTSFHSIFADFGSPKPLFVQNDGKIIVGGFFILQNDLANYRGFIRLNANGSLDSTFKNNVFFTQNPAKFYEIRTICPTPDGGYLVGGDFISYQGRQRKGIAKIDINGILDTNYFKNGQGIDSVHYGNALLPSISKIYPGLNDTYYVMGMFKYYNGKKVQPIIRIKGLSNGINENKKSISDIALYPNPASNQLTVNYFQEMEEAVLEIYNTLGVKQMEVKLPHGQSSYSFSVSHLAKGYYKAIIKEKGNIRGQQGLVVE